MPDSQNGALHPVHTVITVQFPEVSVCALRPDVISRVTRQNTVCTCG
ncbi:hypothetical protein [Candidatus Pandoraea novymonadis]|nr:hypothetical protein [Candidatus Pandoraea novymonadis]